MSTPGVNCITRRATLVLLALPAACGLQPLAPLARSPLDSPRSWPAVRAPAPGQRWVYRVLNFYNGEVVDTVQEQISGLDPITLSRRSARHGELPPEIHAAWGQVRQDPLWDWVQTYDTPVPLWPGSLALGAEQAIHTGYHAGTGSFKLRIGVHTRVGGYERVRLASGEFDTVRIDKFIRLTHHDSTRQNFTRRDTLWLAPGIGRWVARETQGEYWGSERPPNLYREDRLRWEIESWA